MTKNGVEILCVGTELLLGDILNGNARWLAQRVAARGEYAQGLGPGPLP